MHKFEAFLIFLGLPFWTSAEELKENIIWFTSFGEVFHNQPYDMSLIETYIQSDRMLTATLIPENDIHFESNDLLSKFKTVDHVPFKRKIYCHRPVTTHNVLMVLNRSDKNSSVVVSGCNLETLQHFSVVLIQSSQNNVTFNINSELIFSQAQYFHQPTKITSRVDNFCSCFSFLEKMYKDVNEGKRKASVLKIVILVIAVLIAASLMLMKLFRRYEEPLPFIH